MDRKANGSPLRNIIAAMVIAAASAGAGYLAGKDSVSSRVPDITNKPQSSPLQAPPLPAPTLAEVTLGRADIIGLGNAAADAASGGPAVGDMMDGRRFVIRIPLGCGPIANQDVDQDTSYQINDRTLRVRVLPKDWTNLPWVASEMTRRKALGAEGFWIPRPWTQNDACPLGGGDSADPISSLGIVQLFDSESSRVGQRRGRALEATVQLGDADTIGREGLRLVIEGRVARWPGGRETVLCRAANPYDRPVCLVGTKLDSITIENASNGERLSDWRF